MEPQHLDSTWIQGCDESKCVSKGDSDLYNGSFTCYGEDGIGSNYPMMCADGFLPVVTEDESPFVGSEGILLRCFTCCPPGSPSSQATRRCSDPISFEANETESMGTICANRETQKYPRQMKPCMQKSYNMLGTLNEVTMNDSFLCCDSMLAIDEGDTIIDDYSNSTALEIDFLHDSECVPYQNEFYESCRVQNKAGDIKDVGCSLPDFPFAVSLGEGVSNDIASTGMYQCCKNGPALPPFVQDSAFRITVYPVIILYSIAALASIIVIVALLIPLFLQLKNRREKERRNSSLSISSRRSSRRSLRSSRILSRDKESCFSTFNLYLVYLALGDLAFAVYELWMYGSMMNQQFHRNFHSFTVFPSNVESNIFAPDFSIYVNYKLLNMMLNAIMSHEVLVLLRSSRRGQKVNPPSLQRVTLQACGVYFVTAMSILMLYFLQMAAQKADHHGEFEKSLALLTTILVLAFGIPIPLVGYVVYASAEVWKRGYIPTLTGISASDRAMRELFFYFFRIVAIFTGFWVPCLCFLIYAAVSGQRWAFVVCSCSGATQAILTTFVILTKSDARKYILDLLTLSYLFGDRGRADKSGGGLPSTMGSCHQFTTPNWKQQDEEQQQQQQVHPRV